RGSEFIVTLPLTMVAEDKMALPEISDHEQETAGLPRMNMVNGQDATKPLILLVEDNADVVAYTASCLPDYRLAVGEDGKEGFEIAKEIIPDLIVTDVMMPFVDGFELCRLLRNDE